MNEMNSSSQLERNLGRLLKASAVPQDAEFEERMVGAVSAEVRGQVSTVTPRSRITRIAGRSKRAWSVTAVAISVALMAFVFSLQTSRIAWSQVADAVRAMPWIHMRAVRGEGQSLESWISFSRKASATRSGDLVRYEDYRSGLCDQYDLKQKKLFRLSSSDYATKEFDSAERMFQAIFRGDAVHGEEFGGGRIVKQQQRTVTEDGRKWILYELQIDIPIERDLNLTGSIVIRVDPDTKLPDSMTVTRGNQKLQVMFDYPAEGPADIYGLGVPRDVPVEDRMPTPDLDRIIKTIQQNRRDFDDYLAIAGGNSERGRNIVHVIRCKGEKFRVDDGIGGTSRITSGHEIENWWRGHGKEVLLSGSVLCDGRRVYEQNPVDPDSGWKPLMSLVSPQSGRAAADGVRNSGNTANAGEYFVDLLAYPPRLDPQQLASSPLWTTHFDPKGEEGPSGSVRVKLQLAHQAVPHDRRSYHREEFWLQPKYGYAVVKHVTSDCPEIDEDPLRQDKQIISEYEEFRQSPHGLWYPTVSRRKKASLTVTDKEPEGKSVRDEVLCFHLDFTAPLRDEMFSTAWRGDLLDGIHFTQETDNKNSVGLGMIRPPGGVPLFPSRSPITTQALNAATKRLQSVPANDLEKWLAELERITGKKLDDGIEKQGWRTEFASRMSVAFDGLKWNAKAAEILFKRAQTIPPSEGTSWKETFERLFNEQMEHVYLVPLVLIPVDALYQGTTYDAERARTLRARINQLTADDVSLWKDKVDQWGGTRFDAAINIIQLNDYFDKEAFQRDKFHAAIRALKK